LLCDLELIVVLFDAHPMITLIVVLLVGGIILLVMENFIPGFVLGTLGLVSIVSGILLTYFEFGFTFGTLILGVVFAVAVGIFVISIRNFQRMAAGKTLTNATNIGLDSSYALNQDLLGRSGIALTQLRPAGSATINGKKVDVVTQGDLIAANEPVEVIKVEGMRVVVRKIEDDSKYQPRISSQ
jgi:membrane-bound serine protease (ClpP class)